MDVPQGPPLGLLHDHPDGLLVAFVVPLHGPEHPDLGADSLQPGGNVPQGLHRGIPVLLPALLPEGEAGDHVVGGGDLLLGLFQLGPAVLQALPGLLQPLLSGAQVPVQLLQPPGGGKAVLLNGSYLRLAAGDVRRQGGFLGPQLQKPAAQALGGCRHLAELLGAGLDGPGNIRQVLLDLGDPGLGLGDLAFQAAGPVQGPLELLFDAL